MTDESLLPSLTPEQLDSLGRYALFQIDFEQMRQTLKGVWDIEFDPIRETEEGFALERTATGHFRVPEPGIIVTRGHIENALARKRSGAVSERDLVIWATVLLLNDAFAWDVKDEDLIADWLNDISLNLDAS